MGLEAGAELDLLIFSVGVEIKNLSHILSLSLLTVTNYSTSLLISILALLLYLIHSIE